MNKISAVNGFLEFIREQGVIGLAVGFMLGGAVAKVVTALVTDLINPLIGLALGSTTGLKAASFKIGTAVILYGDFIGVCVDFLVIALVVYASVRIFRLDKLEKQKG
ncbi:MscL family protein [Candidatus Uhrbacteria bacterium]|nr:MscL family protein [Candidatus Uhrbacteria bacterium]